MREVTELLEVGTESCPDVKVRKTTVGECLNRINAYKQYI